MVVIGAGAKIRRWATLEGKASAIGPASDRIDPRLDVKELEGLEDMVDAAWILIDDFLHIAVILLEG